VVVGPRPGVRVEALAVLAVVQAAFLVGMHGADLQRAVTPRAAVPRAAVPRAVVTPRSVVRKLPRRDGAIAAVTLALRAVGPRAADPRAVVTPRSVVRRLPRRDGALAAVTLALRAADPGPLVVAPRPRALRAVAAAMPEAGLSQAAAAAVAVVVK
jgi:hypothetical protein